MQSQVTARFVRGVKQLLKENKVRSFRQFALSLAYLPQGLNEIINGKRNVTIELLEKSIKLYNLNANYLFTGKGPLYNVKKKKSEAILTIVTDKDSNERIVHVPIASHAGYAQNIINPVFFEDLFSFTLPGFGFQSGTHRSFDVEGDSMEPTIYNKDQLVCSYIDPVVWLYNIRTNIVYIFVTGESIFVKRAKRIPSDNRNIYLLSDNNFYDPIKLNFNEIKEIWTVKLRISTISSVNCLRNNNIFSRID